MNSFGADILAPKKYKPTKKAALKMLVKLILGRSLYNLA
jgi:hypothetical protein